MHIKSGFWQKAISCSVIIISPHSDTIKGTGATLGVDMFKIGVWRRGRLDRNKQQARDFLVLCCYVFKV